MKLHLHIGSEKSGTTSLQKYLGQNRQDLLAAGFWYPATFTTREDVHRLLTDAVLNRELGGGSPLRSAFEREFKDAKARGATDAIMSSEHLHSLIREAPAAEYLRDFLRDYFDYITVMYYARRQDSLLSSMHSTAVLMGASTNQKPFGIYGSKGHYYFDHLSIAGLWAGVFGSENLTCRIFQRDKLAKGNVIDDFEAVVGLAGDPKRPRVSANESLSLIGRNVLVRLNGSRHRQNDGLRQKLVAIDRQSSRAKVPSLTKSEAAKFLARFDAGNELFFQRYVDPALATGFEAGFDEFPDEVPEPSATEMLDFIFTPPLAKK